MHHRNLLNLYGLKWNPFEMSIPLEGMIGSKEIDHFCWRVETLVMDGGFALVSGNSGTGKSVLLRILSHKLSQIPELQVGVLTRPQSSLGDFYREIGDLFGVELKSANRWGGFKGLREKWKQHINTTLFRPVLLIDEAQEVQPLVLNELRLLSSIELDSKMVITVVLCGDQRLPERFKKPELIPLGSRIKVRHKMVAETKENLLATLKAVTEKAGNGRLMTKELMEILAEHATGNIRVMMIMAGNLLSEAVAKELTQLDEKLFFEVYNPTK